MTMTTDTKVCRTNEWQQLKFSSLTKTKHGTLSIKFTCDQDVVNHLEHGLWKQDEVLSGLLLSSQLLSGNSLNTPASSPAHTTWRWRTPRPHVALHWQNNIYNEVGKQWLKMDHIFNRQQGYVALFW